MQRGKSEEAPQGGFIDGCLAGGNRTKLDMSPLSPRSDRLPTLEGSKRKRIEENIRRAFEFVIPRSDRLGPRISTSCVRGLSITERKWLQGRNRYDGKYSIVHGEAIT